MMNLRDLAVLAPAALAPTAAAQASVWVVDDDGGAGVDFTEIQPAVDAASDGDLVLIRDGDYTSMVVDGKSLTVLGDTVGVANLSVSATVRNVGATQEVTLRNLRVTWGRLNLEDSVGPIWVDDVEVLGAFGFSGGSEGIWVSSCDAVSMHRVVGDPIPGIINPNVSMLNIESSNVYVFDSSFLGGPGFDTSGAPGGHGVHVTSGTAFLYGSEAVGGVGGDGASGGFGQEECTDGGAGGHGIRVESGATLAHLDSTFLGGEGGQGGWDPDGPCDDGPNGKAKSMPAGSTEEAMSGAAQAFTLDSPVREGETSTLNVQGASGMSVLLLASTSQSHLFFPELAGALVIGIGDYFVLPFGATDALGSLTVPITAPSLPPTVQAAQFFTQPLYHHPQQGFFLGSGASLEILDSSL